MTTTLVGSLRLAAAEQGAEPIAWRQRVFSIPFRVNLAVAAQDAPQEVLLYVSADQGQSWQLAQRAEPRQGHFVFHAPQDGTYWFSIRTRHRDGSMRPPGPHQPGLRVLVDTTAPQLELSGTCGSSGEVRLRWQANDANLQPESLSIEYQTDPQSPWQPLAVDKQGTATQAGTFSGQALWWPPSRQGVVSFRGQVLDRAANRAVSQATVTLQPDPRGDRPQPWPPDQVSRDTLARHIRAAQPAPARRLLAPYSPATSTSPALPAATQVSSPSGR